ncbi:MAG TPA: DUF2183 domain-containing protein [Aggregatilineaceae bacterium]|nr:DUF2183 domain-containing protein [Aggregatilineaceae bacterium]
MSEWKKAVAQVASNVEDHYDLLKLRLREKLGIGPVHLLTYLGYGTPTELILRGRAVADHDVSPATENDTIWQNLLNMYRRFTTREIPYAQVRARFGELEQTVQADEEGFFRVHFMLDAPLPPGSMWHTIALELIDYADQGGARGSGSVLVPPPAAQFGVISDLDDTVLRTDVLDFVKMARNTFLNNAHTRLPFAGVAEFYRALQRGTAGSFNPIFYISNSPWNLYDLLVDFFEVREIPLGPMFLTDLGLTGEHFFRREPVEHKLEHIVGLLETYPGLPFILIGDSSETDPEIYHQAAVEHPGRIRAIYIRDVTSEARDTEVQAMIREVKRAGSEMVVIPDTLAAAMHAVERGFILADTLRAIAEETGEDKRAPDGLEALIDALGDTPSTP